MSADNRILVYQAPNEKWYVWEGSCSFSYFEPPPNARVFDSEDEATTFALCEESKMCVCEGGVQRLTNTEIVEALRQEVDMLRNPLYCPECEACGEEGCCSGAMCKKNAANNCLYGDSYALDYQYYREMTNKLYEELIKYNKPLAEKILSDIYDSIYKKQC